MHNIIFALALLLASAPLIADAGARPPAPVPTPAPTPLVGLAPAPRLSPAGLELIYEFEVGGGESYYRRYLSRPTWPGASSGVTIGIGYDLGYNSRAVILSDWSRLAERDRLAAQSGIKGASAKARVATVRDILIEWKLAEEVFDQTTLAKFYGLTSRTFPGLEALDLNAQAALVSLVFNRGSSLVGERRREMAEIKRLVPKRDYAGIAAQIRSMIRIWRGTNIQRGMERRREAEAKLVETAIR